MILLTPIATIVPTATTVTAMTIAVAIFPFLSSSHVSTPFINLLKTDRPIYCAATAKINANINCTNPSAMPTIPSPKQSENSRPYNYGDRKIPAM